MGTRYYVPRKAVMVYWTKHWQVRNLRIPKKERG